MQQGCVLASRQSITWMNSWTDLLLMCTAQHLLSSLDSPVWSICKKITYFRLIWYLSAMLLLGILMMGLFCIYELLYELKHTVHDDTAHAWIRMHYHSHISLFMGCGGEKVHYVLVQLSIITFPSNWLARQILDTKIFPTIYVTNSCLNTIIKQWKLMWCIVSTIELQAV